MSPSAPPLPIPNSQKRTREYLFPQEVSAMIQAAKRIGRHGLRDSTLILMAYRHGLRVSELISLQWEQIDFTNATIYINRLKHGVGVEPRYARNRTLISRNHDIYS
jgi:integrase